MTTLLKRPGTVPVKTVKASKKAPPLSPYATLLAQSQGPMPSLPGHQTPTGLMAGLAGTDWTKAAQGALAPAFKSGMGALNFGLSRGLADAQAQAAAMQGAYTAAGGQMPRVGSEYSSLGGVLSDLGRVLAPGMNTPTAAAQTAAAGAPALGTIPLPDQAGAQYMLGTAPGQALAQSGYYKDIGTAGEAAAEQMQGREQAMVLASKLKGDALTKYLQGGMDLTTTMMGKIPETSIALSAEGRAQAAGALSGLQFETEAKMNMQKLLQNYAQMRADAKTAGQKIALDKWAQQNLNQYHAAMAAASTSRAATAAWKAAHPTAAGAAGLTPNARARMMEKANAAAQGFRFGMTSDPNQGNKLVPWNMVPGGDEAAYNEAVGRKSYTDALRSLMSTYSISKKAATEILNQYYEPGTRDEPKQKKPKDFSAGVRGGGGGGDFGAAPTGPVGPYGGIPGSTSMPSPQGNWWDFLPGFGG